MLGVELVENTSVPDPQAPQPRLSLQRPRVPDEGALSDGARETLSVGPAEAAETLQRGRADLDFHGGSGALGLISMLRS